MTPRAAYAVTIATCLLAAAVGLLLAGTTDDRTPDAAYLDYAKGFAPYTARIHSVPGDAPWEATLVEFTRGFLEVDVECRKIEEKVEKEARA